MSGSPRPILILAALVVASLAPVGPAAAFTPHAPILVVGNADLTAANGVVSGSGSPADPFIIEGWDINTSSSAGIEVRNTDAFLVLRDLQVVGAPAILLDNVRNTRVEDSRLTAPFTAVWVRNGAAIRFERNMITGGIDLDSVSEVVLATNEGIDSYVWIQDATGITLTGNSQQGSSGLSLLGTTTNVTMEANALGRYGIRFDEVGTVEHFRSHTIAPNNTVDGRPLVYHRDCNGLSVEGVTIGQLIVANCTGVRVAAQRVEGASRNALQFAFVDGLNVTDNDVEGTAWVFESNNVTIARNVLPTGSLELWGSSRIRVTANWLIDGIGVNAQFGNPLPSDNVTVDGNLAGGFMAFRATDLKVLDNRLGSLDVRWSDRVEILRNGIHSSPTTGINLWDSDLVAVHHNLLVDNVQGAADNNWWTGNAWDDAYPSGGNYWSDYAGVDLCSGPNQNVCPDPDGIGDIPYAIPGGGLSTDRYPLIQPPDAPPHARFEVVPSAGSTSTTFAANASVSWDLRDAADLLEVRWDWEDDGVWDEPWSTEKTATHGYPLPGAYQIRMVLRDTAGLTDDAVMTATVADAPPTAVARASSSSTLLRVPVLFDALNSSDDVGITAYRWDFGDGGSDTRATVTHAYAARGSFVATLTVWDASTQAGSDIVTILVASNADPTAVAMVSPASTGTTDTEFTFDGANSTDPEGIVAAWDWAFGDGAVASGVQVSHSYASKGAFLVTLTVTDDEGATNQTSLEITIGNRGPEIVSASPSREVYLAANVPASFTVVARDPDGDPLSYVWRVNGSPIAGNSARYEFVGAPGVHRVNVSVSDGEAQVWYEWTVTVTASAGLSSDLVLVAVLILIVVAVAAGLLWKRRRTKAP